MTETLVQRLQAPIDTLVQQVLGEACERRIRLATAESCTGFAGRGGPDDQPGLVHFAAARLGRPTRTLRREYGDIGRERVRLAALTDALEMFRDQIV